MSKKRNHENSSQAGSKKKESQKHFIAAKREKSQKIAEQQRALRNQFRNRLLAVMGSLITLGGLIYFSLSKKDTNISLTSPPASSDNNSPPLPENDIRKDLIELFKPRPINQKISKSEIPKRLQSLLEGYGKIIDYPENYDPQKPNLFLIGNQHIKDESSKKENDLAYSIQKDIVNIYHILASLGVKQQFIEGRGNGVELTHNQPEDPVDEVPLTALPEYKKTGKIFRACTAIEGIYRENLSSFGTEDLTKTLEIQKNMEYAHSDLYIKARETIVLGIAQELGINIYDSPYEVINNVREHLKNLPASEIDKLVEKYMLSNQDYVEYLKKFTEYFYYRMQGRNQIMVESINNNSQKDSIFIVGSAHVKQLHKLLKEKFNIFTIAPPGIEEIDVFYSEWTLEDYKKHIIEHDKYLFGLSQYKEMPSIFNDIN
jgi:hypothetical protein